MRKKLILIITALLLVMCSLLTACTFELDLDSCTGKEPPATEDEITGELPPDDKDDTTEELPSEDEETSDMAFSFEIEDDGFFYPTFIGIVTLDYCPDKVTVVCNSIETTLKPTKIDYVNELYEIRYEQQIIYDYLKKGNHTATVYSYFNSTKNTLTETLTLKANYDYGAVNILNYQTGESGIAMDVVGNYSGTH
ncbi:MAG: hypothetical protein IJX16_05440 [Clostridia bacterium]|nr:hypothetical protein [Clostridia bacterium]